MVAVLVSTPAYLHVLHARVSRKGYAMQQAAETVVAKRQISLWTEREKSAFMDAYKVLSIARIVIIRTRISLFHPHHADQMSGCQWTSQLHKRTPCLDMHEHIW